MSWFVYFWNIWVMKLVLSLPCCCISIYVIVYVCWGTFPVESRLFFTSISKSAKHDRESSVVALSYPGEQSL